MADLRTPGPYAWVRRQCVRRCRDCRARFTTTQRDAVYCSALCGYNARGLLMPEYLHRLTRPDTTQPAVAEAVRAVSFGA